jgi:hypothetical protein
MNNITLSYTNRIVYRRILLFLSITCFAILLSSCSDKDEPEGPTPTEDTYVVTFTGDCDKFKGLFSVSTTESNCFFKSSSFENSNSKILSDSQFKDVYEFTLFSFGKNANNYVKLHCSALCFSDDYYSMKCNIYAMKIDGNVLIYEKEFTSFKPGNTPTSQEYTFTLEI